MNFISKHIFLITFTFLLALLSIKSFGACPGTNLALQASFTDSCGNGSPINVTLTNNSASATCPSGCLTLFRNGASLGAFDVGDAPIVNNIAGFGVYTYKLIFDDGVCSDTSTVIVTYSTGAVVADFTISNNPICVGQNVTFTSTSTGTISGYVWDFGNGNTANTVGPHTETYNTLGTTNIQLTIIGVCGGSNSITKTLTVNSGAILSFSSSNDSVCKNVPITFTNTSVGVSSFNWEFGDGDTSTATSPSHAYANTGTYIVKLYTNSPTCGPDTVKDTIRVFNTMTLDISGDDGTGDLTNCLPFNSGINSEIVTFNNNSIGATSYSWNFGDGSPIFNTNLLTPFTHTFSTYGKFTVVMTASNGVCQLTDTLIVKFGRNPKADFIMTSPTAGCAPLTVTETNLSQNGEIYIWDFGDTLPISTTNFAAPPHTYTLGGGNIITLQVINFCDTDQKSFSPVIIAPLPEAIFTATPNTGCTPLTVSFTNTSNDASPTNNFSWDFGNGVVLNNTITPPDQTYATQGAYTVRLIAKNACGNDTAYSNINVYNLPFASFSMNPSTGCVPNTATFTNNSLGQNNTYEWYVNGNLLSVANTPIANFFTAGTFVYVIRLVATNACGSDDTTITYTFSPRSIADFTISNTSICSGSSATFTNNSSGTNLTYSWDFGNTNTATTSGPHTQTYNTAGNYTITLTVQGTCGDSTITKSISVIQSPTSSFIPSSSLSICKGGEVTFNNLSTPGATYAWTFQNGTPSTSNAFNPGAIVFNTVGTQQVQLVTTLNGCSITSNNVFVSVNAYPASFFNMSTFGNCAPAPIGFINLTPNTAGNTYYWDFANGSTSTLQSPPAQIFINNSNATDSVYAVKLVTTSLEGCKDSVIRNITSYAKPLADFTENFDTVCAFQPVQFTNTSIGNLASNNWNFGDGTTSSASNPSKTYTIIGSYQIQLIVTTVHNCKDTAMNNIVVETSPVANFTVTNACLGDSVAFTNNSTQMDSVVWNFGDGTPSSNTLYPKHLYATSGTFSVSLAVYNSSGCASLTSNTVTILPRADANFTANNVCLGKTMSFNNTSLSAATYLWDFGDASPTSNALNPDHLYSLDGMYNVTLIAYNAYCSDTLIKAIEIDSVPTADFNFTLVCANDSTHFTNTSILNADTFTWSFGDASALSHLINPAHAYSVGGTYSVSLIAGYTSNGCSDTISKSVDAYLRTIPNFKADTVCSGLPTHFTDLTQNTPVNWTYNFGDGNSITAIQNPTYIYAPPGTYAVTLTTISSNACIDSVTKNVLVSDVPVANFTVDSVCLGLATTFTNTSINYTNLTWHLGDNTTIYNQTNFSHTYADSLIYSVELIAYNGIGCTDTVFKNVKVLAKPIADFNTDTVCNQTLTTFVNTSSQATQWNWYFGDINGSTSNLQNPTFTYPSPGLFFVKEVVENLFGCKDSIIKNVFVLQKPIAGFDLNAVCARDTTNFNDTTLNNPTYWSWDFGDGSPIEYTQNPQHIYTAGGANNVTLIVANANGCYDTLHTTVTAYTTPTPNFTFDTACQGTITHFTNLSNDIYPIVWNEWDFGDGNNSYSTSPTYIYQDSGLFTVTLLVINDKGCDTTIQKQVPINFSPPTDFTFDTVCVGLPTSFTVLTGGGQWVWNFGDGTPVDTVNTSTTTHHYASGGNYLVSLESVSNNCGTTKYKAVYVKSDVNAEIYISDSVLCFGDPINFRDSSTYGNTAPASIYWDFGDNMNSSMPNPSHAYTLSGTYYIYLAVSTLGGCKDTAFQTLYINDLPIADFTYTQTSLCENNTSSFNDQSSIGAGNIAQWNWDFDDNSIDINQHPNHIFQNNGSYDVQLTVTSDLGCKDSVTKTLAVLPSPVSDFTYTEACANENTSFSGTSSISSGTISSWHWYFGDGDSSNIQAPTHLYNESGDSILVTLVSESSFGCVDTVQKYVSFFSKVNFDFRATNAEGCAPFNATFRDNSTPLNNNISISNWRWDFGDGSFSFDQNPHHKYKTDGEYTVTLHLTSSDGCKFSDTLKYPILIHPGPLADFDWLPFEPSIITPEIQLYDLSSGANYLAWIIDSKDSLLGSETMYAFEDTGMHTIKQIVVNDFGCESAITKMVHVKPEFKFFVPNTFTPNKDGNNELFRGEGVGVRSSKMVIYDREGIVIYESYDYQTGWDGKFPNGETMKSDIYSYQIFVTDIFGNEHFYTGRIYLFK